MTLWKNADQANAAPKAIGLGAGVGGANAGQVFYGNTTNSGYVNNAVVGVFFADPTEVAVTRRGLNPGWNRINYGTGPLATVAVNAAGTGYSNGDTLIVANGTVNAIATVSANATGNVTAVTLTLPGSGFVNATSVSAAVTAKRLNSIAVSNAGANYAVGDTVRVSNNEYIIATANVTAVDANNGVATVAILTKGSFKPAGTNAQLSFAVLNSNGITSAGVGATFTGTITAPGTGATLTVTTGGRSGRRNIETLVTIMGTPATDGSDDTVLPDA